MAVITRELAERIARKLQARFKRGTKHDIAQIWVEGKLVASFGIRRGSKRDQGHDHVPQQLYVPTGKARLLGECPLSAEEWVEMMREKGIVPRRPAGPTQT